MDKSTLKNIQDSVQAPDMSGNLIVQVMDRPCGSGKSTSLIQEVRENPEKSWLIVVPLLTEVDRFLTDVNAGLPEPILFAPSIGEAGSTKTEHMQLLMKAGMSIVTTHVMLKKYQEYELYLGQYDVVIDEVPDVVEQYNTKVTNGDWKGVIQADRFVDINPDTGEINPTREWATRRLKYSDDDTSIIKCFMTDIEVMQIHYVTDSYFIVHVPRQMFTLSKSCRVMTFLFEGTKLQKFFDRLDINYQHDRNLELENAFKKNTRKLLTIKAHRSNINCAFGKATSPKGKTRKDGAAWLASQWRSLRTDYTTEDVSIVSAKSAWSGLDSNGKEVFPAKDTFKFGTGLAKAQWLPSITRGTNDYIDKTVMVYLHNENMHPHMAQFLDMGSDESKEHHAISEMIQVIYRTAIRKSEPITFVCPDARSTKTLNDWLEK